MNDGDQLRNQIGRQVAHWSWAARRLENLENWASRDAWDGLERYLGIAVRRSLAAAVDRLQKRGHVLVATFNAARNDEELEQVRKHLVAFRRHYLRTETTLDFYADAVNTRTSLEIAALLRACDVMASRSMAHLLDPLGKKIPPVLTYLDKGLGASILKAGLRLWDGGTTNPAATIKIVRHNLYRPTALIHEAGHQVAHILGWNEVLAATLYRGLVRESEKMAAVWAAWASEIAADLFAFVHTGYASVAALHDVIAGDYAYVFRYTPDDPHPISYLRVLMGTRMCAEFFGAGPWDELESTWIRSQPLSNADPDVRTVIRQSLPILSKIVTLCLRTPLRELGGRSLVAWISPERVSPAALLTLEEQAGPAIYTSDHWIGTEPLRLLALTGLKAAVSPNRAAEVLSQQKNWMIRLGSTSQIA